MSQLVRSTFSPPLSPTQVAIVRAGAILLLIRLQEDQEHRCPVDRKRVVRVIRWVHAWRVEGTGEEPLRRQGAGCVQIRMLRFNGMRSIWLAYNFSHRRWLALTCWYMI